jgi:hypothetical protein
MLAQLDSEMAQLLAVKARLVAMQQTKTPKSPRKPKDAAKKE